MDNVELENFKEDNKEINGLTSDVLQTPAACCVNESASSQLHEEDKGISEGEEEATPAACCLNESASSQLHEEDKGIPEAEEEASPAACSVNESASSQLHEEDKEISEAEEEANPAACCVNESASSQLHEEDKGISEGEEEATPAPCCVNESASSQLHEEDKGISEGEEEATPAACCVNESASSQLHEEDKGISVGEEEATPAPCCVNESASSQLHEEDKGISVREEEATPAACCVNESASSQLHEEDEGISEGEEEATPAACCVNESASSQLHEEDEGISVGEEEAIPAATTDNINNEPENTAENMNPIERLQNRVIGHSICDSWQDYRNKRKDTSTQFIMGILVCGIGIIALVVCLAVGLNSASAVCQKLLTVGTILGGAIAAIGGIWMTVAQPSHISKKKIVAVVAGLIGIGSLISTTMEQIKEWCPDKDSEPTAASFDIENKNLLLIGGNSEKYGINNFITVYNPFTTKFSAREVFLPWPVEGMVAARNKKSGLIMVAGGYNRLDNALKNAFFYDETQKSSTSLTQMGEARNLAAGGWIDESFIICGGMKGQQFSIPSTSSAEEYFTMSCERYSVEKNQWSALANVTHPRVSTGYVVHDKQLYTFGGFDGGVTDLAYVYSFENDSWRSLKPVPGKRNVPAAVVFNDSIIICGGFFYVPLFDCVQFNPKTEEYSQLQPMVNPRYAFSLVHTNDNKLLAIGGKAVGNNFVKTVEMFDGNLWQEIGDLSFGVSYFDAELTKNN